MKDVRLNNGVMMPAIGFGVFQIPANETERVVTDAIKVGYRMFDTASAYFNEEQVGNAIRRSGIGRDHQIVGTRLRVRRYVTGFRPIDEEVGIGLPRSLPDAQTLRKLLCCVAGHGAALQGGTHPGHRRDELF